MKKRKIKSFVKFFLQKRKKNVKQTREKNETTTLDFFFLSALHEKMSPRVYIVYKICRRFLKFEILVDWRNIFDDSAF